MNPSTSSPRLSTPLIGPDAIDKRDAPVGSFKYYALCGIGGALASGLTTALHPKEIVVPARTVTIGPNASLKDQRQYVSTPTLSRCWKKGVAKFGLYDGFKDLYAKMFADPAHNHNKLPIYWLSAYSAQTFACAFFSDFSALIHRDSDGKQFKTRHEFLLRNKAQADREYVLNLRRRRNAMIQFPCYEFAADALYRRFKPKANCSKPEQLAVTFTAGYIAGIACAVITHPFDVLPPNPLDPELRYAVPAEQPGLRGLTARSSRMASLLAAQWTIYEGFKIMMNISNQPTSQLPKGRHQPEMPESLRKKLEELKLKKMKEQKPKGDLSIHLTPPPSTVL